MLCSTPKTIARTSQFKCGGGPSGSRFSELETRPVDQDFACVYSYCHERAILEMEQLFSGALSAAQQWLDSTPRAKQPDGDTGASSGAGPSTSLQVTDKESRRAAKAARKADKRAKIAKKAAKEAASQTAPTGLSKKHKRDREADSSALATASAADVSGAPNDDSATEKRKKKKKKRKQAGGDEPPSQSHATTSEPAKKKRKSDAADKDLPVLKDSAPTSSRPTPVPPSQRYSSGSQTFQRRSSERQPKTHDDQIRAKVRSPQGLNEFLCERWIDPTELRRLKDAGSEHPSWYRVF